MRNHSNASARFDGRDEAGDAVVFLDDLRRTIQWRKQACNPSLMLWIVFTRSRQRVRRMQNHANGLTLYAQKKKVSGNILLR